MQFAQKHPSQQFDVHETPYPWFIINLSSQKLCSTQNSLLSKDQNFSLALISVSTEDIISDIECSVRRLSSGQVGMVRCATSKILRTDKAPSPNIAKKVSQALRELKSNSYLCWLRWRECHCHPKQIRLYRKNHRSPSWWFLLAVKLWFYFLHQTEPYISPRIHWCSHWNQ